MEEEEQTLKSNPIEEEYPVVLLIQWEMDLKMLEDWLDNPKPKYGCQGIAKPEETCPHREQLEEDGMQPVQSELQKIICQRR
jgi:hypothetical protein